MEKDERTILLIEDSADEAALARLALDRTGVPHELVHFSEGARAVEYLYSPITRRSPPALILLDLKLPGMDGKAILREIRGNPSTARVPVVALTSSALEQDRVDAYSLGVNSYWVKPTDFTVFLDEMTVLTTYWLALNVSPPAFRARPALATGRFAAEGPILTPRRQIPLPAIVVDADPEDLRRTIEALASLAVPARPLVGFEAVVDFLKGSGGPPPLLDPAFPRLFLVEVELDFGDGRDVLQALRYRTDHHAMVIMFTRRTDPAFVSECYRVKVSGVVRKPDDPAEYRAAVRLLASYWMLLNEPPPDPIWSKRAIAHPG